jgi:magnesium-transporting ATPase (P-type)
MNPLSAYFLVLMFLSLFPSISPTDPASHIVPVMLVLLVAVARETAQERNRQREDRRLNYQPAHINRNGKWIDVHWEDVCVGDVVLVQGDTQSPADIVMVASSAPGNSAYIQTTNLDGESNFKPRFGINKAVYALDMIASWNSKVRNHPGGDDGRTKPPELIIHADPPRSDLDYFNGKAVYHVSEREKKGETNDDDEDDDNHLSLASPISSLTSMMTRTSSSTRGGEKKDFSQQLPIQVTDLTIKNFIPRESTIKGAEWIVGIVVYTGIETKVLLGQQRPKYKKSKIDRMTNKMVMAILAFEVIVSVSIAIKTSLSFYTPRWWLVTTSGRGLEVLYSFLACMLLITPMLPISLIISLLSSVNLAATKDLIEKDLKASTTDKVPSALSLRPVNGKVSGPL